MSDFRTASGKRNPAPAALCAGVDPRRLARRRPSSELPCARHRQAASMAARNRSAGLAFHHSSQSARQRRAPRRARRRCRPGRGRDPGADRRSRTPAPRCNCAISNGRSPACRRSSARSSCSSGSKACATKRSPPSRYSDRHGALAPVARPRHVARADGHEGRECGSPGPAAGGSRRPAGASRLIGCAAAPGAARRRQPSAGQGRYGMRGSRLAGSRPIA